MNINDTPTPMGNIINTAGNARQAIHLLVVDYERALELITLKNAAIEDLNQGTNMTAEDRIAAITYLNNLSALLAEDKVPDIVAAQAYIADLRDILISSPLSRRAGQI